MRRKASWALGDKAFLSKLSPVDLYMMRGCIMSSLLILGIHLFHEGFICSSDKFDSLNSSFSIDLIKACISDAECLCNDERYGICSFNGYGLNSSSRKRVHPLFTADATSGSSMRFP